MERMITERLTYYVEKNELMTPYQSGFRRGRSTLDPLLCLESEVRKAQANKECVVAVFFDVEKAYDMMWKEGLLIKLDIMGLGGNVYNWIMDFLFGRAIRVRVGNSYSRRHEVENGTPQGSVISPLLFSIMINDIYTQVGSDIGKSLFADDGAIWKRGRNVNYIVGKIQEAITEIESWSLTWGFRLSVEKTETLFFTRKRIGEEVRLKLYAQELKDVKTFTFLGIWLDERVTWSTHIDKVVDKCKRVLNVMRCLAGTKWGLIKLL